MYDPQDILERSVDRLREIVWWNSRATRLHGVVENPEQIPSLLVEAAGPYIERVRPPAPYASEAGVPESWTDTATRLDVAIEVREAVSSVLFHGQCDLSLYYHQGRALELLNWKALKTGKSAPVTIITVPTASGKTESFLLPVLDTSVHAKRAEQFQHQKVRAQLRALFLYPMKTLAIDQVNRFIKYLYQVNEHLPSGVAPLRLGIWDGDTPYTVGGGTNDADGRSVVERDDPARGLRCPVCDEPILYRETGLAGCRSHPLPFLSLTREDIARRGVDLLVTNPEAIEFLLTSPTQQPVLQSERLTHIVVDETHTWNGVEGASFGLLLMRLRQRYTASNPRVVLSSATVADPRRFASQLLQVDLDDVNEVRFRSTLEEYLSRFQSAPPVVNYARIPETSAHEVIALLIKAGRSKECALTNATEEQAAHMVELLGLGSRVASRVVLTETGTRLISGLAKGRPADMSPEQLTTDLTEHAHFVREWAERVATQLPELLDLINHCYSDEISFTHRDNLIAYVSSQPGVVSPEPTVLTLLSMGRVADLLFDKYHIFLKPASGMVYCHTCRTVHSNHCPHGHTVWTLSFCNACHTPAVSIPQNEGPNPQGQRKTKDKPPGSTRFLVGLGQLSDGCRCAPGKRPSTSEPFMAYQTFASYLVSTIPALLPTKKMLLFADGRALVDLVTDVTQSLEYSLVSDRLAAFYLLQQPDMTMEELRAALTRVLFSIYLNQTPLRVLKENRSHNEETANLLRQLKKATDTEIFGLLNWGRKGRLFEPAILTVDAVDLPVDPLEKAFVHTLMAELITAGRDKDEETDQLTPLVALNSLRRRFEESPGFRPLVATGKLDLYVSLLQERYGLNVREIGKSGKTKAMLTLPPAATKRIRLRVPKAVTYCTSCYKGYPAILDQCPDCGSRSVLTGSRQAQQGRLPNPEGVSAPFALDHWAQDILGPALDWCRRAPEWGGEFVQMTDRENGFDRVVVLSHKAGVPMVVRGAIESGFRDEVPPSVNVVCATPTMEMGIDIGTLDCAAQLGVPPTKASYLQRVGRTGRKMATPSLIFVVIRNENAVDGFFFGNLGDRFLNRKLAPIRVPSPPPGILVTHVMAEVLAVVGRLSGLPYREYYLLTPPMGGGILNTASVEQLFAYLVKHHIARFCADVRTHLNAVRDHLAAVFGHISGFSPDHYLQLIFAGEQAALPATFAQLFERLDGIFEQSRSTTLVPGFLGQHRVLAQLLGTLGLMPRFRGGGAPIPIVDTAGEGLMVQSAPYALRENAPGGFDSDGPRRGALWRVEGRGFQMRHAVVHEPALTAGHSPIHICKNTLCQMPFHPYPSGAETCPFCDMPLASIQVFEYAYGVGQRYRAHPFNRIIETQAFVQSHVEEDA